MAGETRLTGGGETEKMKGGGGDYEQVKKYRKQGVGPGDNISRIGEKIGLFKREGSRNKYNISLTQRPIHKLSPFS